MNEMLNKALELAKKGYAVFPLIPLEKRPATKHGVKDATTDLEAIRSWWDQMPDANIGVACGAPSHGLVVIDVDNKNGHSGTDALKRWTIEHGDFPKTLTVYTANNGFHLYFRDTGSWKNAAGVLDGVDIRTDGGYVVAAGSKLERGIYKQLDERPAIPSMPNKSVRDLLSLSGHSSGNATRHESSFIDDGQPISEGGRSDFLSHVAGALVTKNPGWSLDQLKDEVRRINEERCCPPLPDAELEKTIFKSLTRWKKKQDAAPPFSDASQPYFPPEEWSQIEMDQRENDDLELTSLTDIEEKEVEWLIPGYVPKRMLTIVCGTGGTGKTSLWCSLAASISRGAPTVLEGTFPREMDRSERDVLYFSAEDSTEYTLKETLLKNHADMQHIHTLELSDNRFSRVKFTSKYLEKLIDRYRPALVVFDPLQAFIDARVDMSKRNAMRDQLRPLVALGDMYNAAFIIIMHTNKARGNWGRMRMADSSDVWDIARSVLMLGVADSNQHEIYLSQEKCNVAPLAPTVILKNTNRVMTFEGYSDKKDFDFVSAEQNAKVEGSMNTSINECSNSILSELADQENGVMLASDMEALLKVMGYSVRTITGAKKELKEANMIFYKRESDPETGRQKVGGKWLICRKK